MRKILIDLDVLTNALWKAKLPAPFSILPLFGLHNNKNTGRRFKAFTAMAFLFVFLAVPAGKSRPGAILTISRRNRE